MYDRVRPAFVTADSVLYELSGSVLVAVSSIVVVRCGTEHGYVTGSFRRMWRVSRFLVCPTRRTCN
jgi:prolipoprotein diacylglyceryltransferase